MSIVEKNEYKYLQESSCHLSELKSKKGKLPHTKKVMLECVHEALREALGVESWNRFQRIIEIEPDDFETSPQKTDDLVIIELTLFPSRSKEQKQQVIQRITSRLHDKLAIAPTDVFIVIHEPPLENWGMGGHQKG